MMKRALYVRPKLTVSTQCIDPNESLYTWTLHPNQIFGLCEAFGVARVMRWFHECPIRVTQRMSVTG